MSIRKATVLDYNFIISPWHANILAQYTGEIDRNIIESECQPRIAKLMAGGTVLVSVDDDTGLLLGGIVFETIGQIPVIHFAYTRKTHRKLGVLSALLKHAELIGVPAIATINTTSLQFLKQAIKASCFYNPWFFNGVQK
jgi:hypothetical protein